MVSPQGVVSSHSIAGVTNALLVAEDNAGTLTAADGATGQLFSEVRDPRQLTPDVGFNFPATVVGTASPVQSYTLTNLGTTLDLNGYQGLTLLSLPNRQNFPQAAPTTCVAGTTVLSAGGSCVLSYTYSPTFAGADSEYDYIDSSAPTPNYSVYCCSTTFSSNFTGFGVSQYANTRFSAAGATPFSACSGYCSLGFGNVAIGQSATLALTVTNIGAGTLQLSSIINNAGSAFTYDASNCGTSLAGATISNGTVTNTPSCTINITFKPTHTGGDGGPLYIIDNSGGGNNNEQSISLGGTGFSATPVLTLPANITAAATSANGAVVTFTATATDPVYGSLTPSCMPASGSTFPIGTTTVTCSVTDPANNTATGSFTVTVQDTTAPVITVPANITTAATSASGAVVTYSATATDLVDGTVSVSCMPASGSTFPIGTTTVTCTATDTHTNQSHASFTVTVQDTTPPVITVPANITIAATSASGAVVTYTATAMDLVDGTDPVACTPASGATFPLGTTTVTCAATDSAHNSSTASFTVTVQAPPYVFVINSAGSVSSLFINGAAQSSAVAGGGIGAAVDRNGLVFSITADGTGVSTFNDNGTLANTTSGVLNGASALAIDGGDQLWIAFPGGLSTAQILNPPVAGSVTDPALAQPGGVAVDLSGNVWVTDSQSNTLHEIVGGAVPTTPLANAVQSATPGVQP